MGIDINDPRITVPGGILLGAPRGISGNPSDRFSEDTSGYPLHLLLFICTCAWVVWAALRRQQDRLAFVYTTAVVAGYVVFCATIKWQLWNARLHLPLVIMAAAPAGLALSRMARERVTSVISLLFLLLTVPPLFLNPGHPLIGKKNIFNLSREDEYFLYRSQIAPSYIQSADFLASQQCNSIGLARRRGEYEYPLWVLMRDRLGRWPRVQMVPTRKVSDAWQDIDCVVILDPQSRERVLASEPPEPWQSRNFGDVTVQTRR